MAELLVDFITSLDGYAAGEGWPGFWGLQGPEYLAWLEEQPEVTYLMGATTPADVRVRRRGGPGDAVEAVRFLNWGT